jgi:hypothetical protein
MLASLNEEFNEQWQSPLHVFADLDDPIITSPVNTTAKDDNADNNDDSDDSEYNIDENEPSTDDDNDNDDTNQSKDIDDDEHRHLLAEAAGTKPSTIIIPHVDDRSVAIRRSRRHNNVGRNSSIEDDDTHNSSSSSSSSPSPSTSDRRRRRGRGNRYQYYLQQEMMAQRKRDNTPFDGSNDEKGSDGVDIDAFDADFELNDHQRHSGGKKPLASISSSSDDNDHDSDTDNDDIHDERGSAYLKFAQPYIKSKRQPKAK